jgi:IS4 transposase
MNHAIPTTLTNISPHTTSSGICKPQVTRLKDNADYMLLEELQVPKNRNILADQLIMFSGYYAQKNCPYPLRRIVVWDNENEREIVLLTNHLDFGATTVAAIYKDRWQIEIFFKALKQNLKVKTFVGTSENALYIQIWTAVPEHVS